MSFSTVAYIKCAPIALIYYKDCINSFLLDDNHNFIQPYEEVSFFSNAFHFNEIGEEYNPPFAKLLIENIPDLYY